MRLEIFFLWVVFLILALYYSFGKKRWEAHIALIALGFGLFGILVGTGTGSGIDFLSQVDSNGNLIYTAISAANDVTIQSMAWAAFGVGMIGIIKLIAVLFGRDI